MIDLIARGFKISKWLFLLPVLMLATGCAVQQTLPAEQLWGEVAIGDKTFRVEIANTPASRAKGLMRRQNLPADQGMLFVFEDYGFHSFWMKDTLIPLDIIWIADRTIVDIKKNVLPPASGAPLQTYRPVRPANFVLEVNAGTAEQYGWRVGDKVQFFGF